MIAIGFDFDHTLGFDNGLERNALFDLAEDLGAPLDRTDANEAARLNALLHEFREGRMTMAAMVDAFVASLTPRPPADTLAHEERFKQLACARVDRVTPSDGARELLDELERREIPYAILTNGWSPLQQLKLKQIGHMGAVLVSDEVGVAKPHHGAFLALERQLGVPAANTWFVGDNPLTDICGAMAAGMHAVWYDLGEHAYPADMAPPEHRITALAELLALLPGGTRETA
jgi:HAD superfamily hydrolase (TIGR01549 family)